MAQTEASNNGAPLYHGNIYLSGAVLEQYRRLRTNGGNGDNRKTERHGNSNGALPGTDRSLAATNRYSLYNNGGSKATKALSGGTEKRHQSIPSKWDTSRQDSKRQVNSAPTTKPTPNTVPLPKLNNLVVRDAGGRQDHAGVSTMGRESFYLRTDKFASSWAKARADHGTLVRHSERTERDKKGRNVKYQPGQSHQNTHKVQSVSGRTTGQSSTNETHNAESVRGDQPSAQSISGPHSNPVGRTSVPSQNESNIAVRRGADSSPSARLTGSSLSPNMANQTSVPKASKSSDSNSAKSSKSASDSKEISKANGNTRSDDKTNVRPDKSPHNLAKTNVWASIRRKQRILREKAALRQNRSQKIRTQQVGEETMPKDHHPAVNDLKKVVKLYTAMTIVAREFQNKRGKRSSSDGDENSGTGSRTEEKSTVPPWHRNEYVLTRREVDMYRHINKVYGDKSNRNQRQVSFYNKLEEIQEQQIQEHNDKLDTKEKHKEETRQRQQKQLRNVRDKFFNERMRRFSKQYVTSKVLEYEKLDREEYGLPEEYSQTVVNPTKVKKKKVPTATLR